MQVGEQASAQVLDVGGPLTQVIVIHQFEAVDVLAHHLAQGALRPLTRLDDLAHLAAQGSVLEHHQVDIE